MATSHIFFVERLAYYMEVCTACAIGRIGRIILEKCPPRMELLYKYRTFHHQTYHRNEKTRKRMLAVSQA